MAQERNLQHALNLAAQIRQEHSREFDPIIGCPECGENTFVEAGRSDDGVMEIGKCLHCGFERNYEQAQDDALGMFLERHEDD